MDFAKKFNAGLERDALEMLESSGSEYMSVISAYDLVKNKETAGVELENGIHIMKEYKNPFTDWISVDDRLPEVSNEVLIRNTYGCYDHAEYSKGLWYSRLKRNNYIITNVTHWMPLPDPPKGV